MIEATGGSLSCHRCDRVLPSDARERDRWGSFFDRGRLVLLACPDCLTETEREQIAERAGAPLWEVASARAATAAELRDFAHAARERSGGEAPPRSWLENLAEGGRHVGVLAAEPEGDRVLVMWSGETRDGRRVAAFGEVAIERWMALEELYVPYWVQEGAAEAARARPQSTAM